MIQMTLIQIDNYGPWTVTPAPRAEADLQILQAELYADVQRQFAAKGGLVFFTRFDNMLAITNNVDVEDFLDTIIETNKFDGQVVKLADGISNQEGFGIKFIAVKSSLDIANLKLFGETTKSLAVVETAVQTGNKTEVFISNIERLFNSGEYIRVVDSNNQDVLFDGQPLRAKIVGQISQIKIDPLNRGLLYQPGDPVVVYNLINF